MLTKIVSLFDVNGAMPAKDEMYLLLSYPPFGLAL
jgi:hypothetical protein